LLDDLPNVTKFKTAHKNIKYILHKNKENINLV